MVIYIIGILIQSRTILEFLPIIIYFLIKSAIWTMIALSNAQKPK